MSYFTLKINTSSKGNIYETDFLPDLFEIPVHRFVAELRRQNKMGEFERFNSRIIPKYDELAVYDLEKAGTAKELKEKVDKDKISLGRNIDIHFDKSKVTNQPVTYFTIKLYILDRDFIIQKDFPLTVIDFFINSILSMLIKKGKLNSNEEFYCEIIARDDNQPKINHSLFNRTIVIPIIFSKSDEKLLLDKDYVMSPDENDSIGDLISLDSEEDHPSIKFKKKRIDSYKILDTVGEIRDRDLKIYMHSHAYNRLKEETEPSIELGKELIGILIGDVCEDVDSGKLFIEIHDIIPAKMAPSDVGHAVLDNDTLNMINDEMSRTYPGKCNLGWYHTHIVKMIKLLSEGNFIKGQAMGHLFFSTDDYFLHQNYFKKPWHIAIVVDPFDKNMIIFQWKNEKIDSCGGCYIFNEYKGLGE